MAEAAKEGKGTNSSHGGAPTTMKKRRQREG